MLLFNINNGCKTIYITSVNGATYTTKQEDEFLNILYTATGSVAITLSTIASTSGNKIVIKDSAGNATANNIVVDTEGTQKIDGLDTYTINGNYDSVTLLFNGTNWVII